MNLFPSVVLEIIQFYGYSYISMQSSIITMSDYKSLIFTRSTGILSMH